MLFNYLKTAVRSLLRYRFFSFINIAGLAVAMSICMMLIMLIADQLNYDRYNTNADRIYRVTTLDVNSDGRVMTENQRNSASCMPLGPELLANYTGVEQAVRLMRGFGNNWLQFENQDVNIPLSGFFADQGVLEFFQYELQFGNPADALAEPFTVVLSRESANRLFKEENPVGQTIKVGDLGTYTVTGVLKQSTRKSHIVFDGLASMASVKSLEASGKMKPSLDNWSQYGKGWTYILAEHGATKEEIQLQLDQVYARHVAPVNKPGFYKMAFGLQPLLSITPGDVMNNSIGPVMLWIFLYILGGLALVILLTSCFNFTNLSIARSLTRSREIGIRKVSGAARWQIFSQFMTEAVVVAIAALLMAILLLEVLKPMLLQLNFARFFRWDLYAGPGVYAVFLVFAVVVGLLAGFFPAVVMSGFQPIAVLKNLSNLKLFSRMGLRKTLLVSQFALSFLFIVTVLTIYSQLDLFTHQDHGFNMKNNILLKLNKTNAEVLKAELQKYSNLTSITATSHVPAAGTSHGANIVRHAGDAAIIDAGYFTVDEDYADNMKLNLVSGTFFGQEHSATKNSFAVINEAAAKSLGFERVQDAVGESFELLNDSTTRTIIGVVGNYNHRDLTRAISPVVLLYESSSNSVLQVAYVGSYHQAAAAIEKAWTAVNPGLKADYVPVESEINKYYELVFGDLARVVGFISFLAILISCLGLLGMATYATETRIKEISIRKVLGATQSAIVLLLSRSFVSILGIAIGVGMPLAWFINNLWLEQIAYRTHIGFGILGLGVLVISIFGLLTVGSQTFRAAAVNPAEQLKGE